MVTLFSYFKHKNPNLFNKVNQPIYLDCEESLMLLSSYKVTVILSIIKSIFKG